jgi:hypothetical protein
VFTFTAPVRVRNNGKTPASRHFVTVPADIAQQIQEVTADLPRKGRWSVKIQARIGFITRETSIFLDKKLDSYLLPIKADIRKQLQISEWDQLSIEIVVIP